MFKSITAILTLMALSCNAHASDITAAPKGLKTIPAAFHGIWQEVAAGTKPSCAAKDAALRDTITVDGVRTPEGFCKPVMVRELSPTSVQVVLTCEVDGIQKFPVQEWHLQQVGNERQLFVKGFDPGSPDNERFRARCESVAQDEEDILLKIARSPGPAKEVDNLCYIGSDAEMYIFPEGEGHQTTIQSKQAGGACIFMGVGMKNADGFVFKDSLHESGCELEILIDDQENISFRASPTACAQRFCRKESSFNAVRFPAKDRFPC